MEVDGSQIRKKPEHPAEEAGLKSVCRGTLKNSEK